MACRKIKTMKKTIIFLLAVVSVIPAQAQSRFQVMAQQIAGMGAYLQSIKSVYSTTQKGLNEIHSLKNGNFDLNQAYFNSLGNVSPAVRNDPKIKAIGDLQQQIDRTFSNAISWQKQYGVLTSDETVYLRSIYNAMLSECGKDLDELTLVITDGKLQMTDDARIQKIGAIYTDMKDKYSFSRSFTGKAQVMAVDRKENGNDQQTLRSLYNLN